MAFTPEDLAAKYATSLAVITEWARQHRAQGHDPFAMTSGNGNQGLDAMLAQAGVTLPEFNQGAIALGITFTTGTTWLRAYAAALQNALGVQNVVVPGAGTGNGGGAVTLPALTSDNWPQWALYGGVGVLAVMLVMRARRRR